VISVSISGSAPELQAKLLKLASATGGGGRQKLLEIAGRHMVSTEVPRVFRENGPGWARPKYRRGEPLKDTGVLKNSIAYRVQGDDVRIGTPLVYARAQQEGATIRPVRRQWLAIPLSPPLTTSERRTKTPRDFHGAFVLIHGPEGPGLYRKSGVARSVSLKTRRTSYRSGTLGIERIFAFVKSVEIKPRPFLRWTPRAILGIKNLWEAYVRRAAA